MHRLEDCPFESYHLTLSDDSCDGPEVWERMQNEAKEKTYPNVTPGLTRLTDEELRNLSSADAVALQFALSEREHQVVVDADRGFIEMAATAANAWQQRYNEAQATLQVKTTEAQQLRDWFRKHCGDEIMVCTDSWWEYPDRSDLEAGCGPFVACDDNGCCVSCGNVVEIMTLDAALVLDADMQQRNTAKAERELDVDLAKMVLKLDEINK